MQRCAIYIRVSTEEQKINGLSLDTQMAALELFAKDNGLHIIDRYIDAGLTARKRITHRKELQRLLEDVQCDKIDLIIFTKLDRWFRNIADYYKVQEILERHHVNWKTIYENYDTSTANGRLHINIMLSIAQDEADRTSERIKTVFENKRSRGETTASIAPLGYKIEQSKLLVNEETKQIAIDIFEYYDKHHSVSACVRLAKEKYDYKIYDYSIRRMFQNTTYIGKFREYDNFCEAIISEDLFQRIKCYTGIREFKNQLIAGRIYLFTSLIKCKECGRNMTSSFTIQKQKTRVKEYHYYGCKESKYNCPHKKKLNEDYLETYLLQTIEKPLQNYIVKMNRKNKKITTNTIDVSKIKKRLEKLKDLYLDNLIDKDSYKLDYDLLTKQLKNNRIPLKKFTSNYSELPNIDFKEIYHLFTLQERKAFWLGVVDHIIVDQQNHITIFFR